MKNQEFHIPTEPLLECPACGLPSEIVDRFTLDGTPGPVEHVKVVCVVRHWFTLPADELPPPQRSSPAEPGRGRDLGERARR